MKVFLIVTISIFALSCSEQVRNRMGKISPVNASKSANNQDSADDGSYPTEHDVLKGFPTGDEQLNLICARGGQDKVREVFCGSERPSIRSLSELQAALGFTLERESDIVDRSSKFAFVGHSTSLVGRHVSAANPRVLLFNNSGNAMGFARGEQFVEIISSDPSSGKRAFFLGRFKQECNDSEAGCQLGELLGPAIESAWTSLDIYEDVDLKNTVFDCAQCHQPKGPESRKLFLQRELRAPWNHYFMAATGGGNNLLHDYKLVHSPQETYGGIPGNLIPQSDPQALEEFIVANGDANFQPFVFDSVSIEIEHMRGLGHLNLPQNNLPNVASPTWQNLYERSVRGEIPQVPYFDVRITDSGKLKKAGEAYQKFINGEAKQLPDIREVLKDSALRDMGFMVKKDLSAEGILKQACTQCHNSNLDQSISRANFNVDLEKMTREAKDKAIQRLLLPSDHLLVMPPRRFKVLTAEEIERVVEFLKE